MLSCGCGDGLGDFGWCDDFWGYGDEDFFG